MSAFESNAILIASNNKVNEVGAREYLTSQNWPVGLQDVLIHSLKTIPLRFFVYDDSGSVSFYICIVRILNLNLLTGLLTDDI